MSDEENGIPDDQIEGNVDTPSSKPSDARPKKGGWNVPKDKDPELIITINPKEKLPVHSATITGNVKSKLIIPHKQKHRLKYLPWSP